jgi:hypothetical protein
MYIYNKVKTLGKKKYYSVGYEQVAMGALDNKTTLNKTKKKREFFKLEIHMRCYAVMTPFVLEMSCCSCFPWIIYIYIEVSFLIFVCEFVLAPGCSRWVAYNKKLIIFELVS